MKTASTKKPAKPEALVEEVGEIYKDQRPKMFKDIIGQRHVTQLLIQQLRANKVQHTMLFSGPSGVGKTTIARILASKLNGGKPNRHDIYELNCAGESRGIDTIRAMKENFRKRPLRPHGCKVFILDEAAKLTGDAQSALLKMLEDTPPYVYVILCSTDPDKILNTIRTRAMLFKCALATTEELLTLIRREAVRYSIALTKEEEVGIANAAQGSHRKALVLLNGVRFVTDAKDRQRLIERMDDSVEAVNLARALMSANGLAAWPAIAKVLKELKGTQDPESVRWVILSYFAGICVNQPPKSAMFSRCLWVMQCFRESFTACGYSGLVTSSAASLSSK